jgi:hypothetical protein
MRLSMLACAHASTQFCVMVDSARRADPWNVVAASLSEICVRVSVRAFRARVCAGNGVCVCARLRVLVCTFA